MFVSGFLKYEALSGNHQINDKPTTTVTAP